MNRDQNIQQFFIRKKSNTGQDTELIRTASNGSSDSDKVSSESDDDSRQVEETELTASPGFWHVQSRIQYYEVID